jgi:hypothetical protein
VAAGSLQPVAEQHGLLDLIVGLVVAPRGQRFWGLGGNGAAVEKNGDSHSVQKAEASGQARISES